MWERPWALWALPLAFVPVLIHWLSRRSARRVPFGDLYLAREALSRARRASRWRDAALLATRIAAFLSLLLSCAGPSATAPGGAGRGNKPSESLSLLVWLDCSYSMRCLESGESRFELAKRAGREALAALRPGDRVAVATFSNRVDTPPAALRWRSREEAAAALASAKPGFSGTDFAAPLAAGDVFLSSAPGRRVELFLTDGAAHGFRGKLPPLGPEILRLGLRWPGKPNAFLARAVAESSPGEPGMRLRLEARGLDRPRNVKIWLGGRPVGRARVAPGSSWAEVALPEEASGLYSGRAVLDPDDLLIDDERWFSFKVSPRPRILCLYHDASFLRAPAGGYFLKRLCGAAEGPLIGYDCDFLDIASIEKAALPDYRAILLADWSTLPAQASERLARFVLAGGGVWIFPGQESGSEPDLGRLGELASADLGSLVAAEAKGVAAAPGFLSGEPGAFDLSRVSFSAYRLMTVKPGARVLLRSASGYPLECVGKAGTGAIVVSAFGLGSRWGNMALKPFFAPWLERSLKLMAPGPPRLRALGGPVGRSLEMAWESRVAAPQAALVTNPKGRSLKIWVRDRRANFDGTDRPGLYRVEDLPGGNDRVYAVNLDPTSGESELEPEPSPPWKTLSPESFRRDFDQAVRGRPLSGALLAFAALVLCLEMLLSLPRRSLPAKPFLALLFIAALMALPHGAAAQENDRFTITQWRIGDTWDPYPEVPGLILRDLDLTTSVLTSPGRRVVTLEDTDFFFSPLVILAGKDAPPPLGKEALAMLRDFLDAGGMLWIEDVSGLPESSFDRWVRMTLSSLRPGDPLTPIPLSNAVFKSFYLLRRPAGRVLVEPAILGLSRGRRWSVVYSRNDILGAWAVDPLGKPLYPCVPGGEQQRLEAKRLAINIILYALTGNYKSDAVHQPYLMRKMREGTLP